MLRNFCQGFTARDQRSNCIMLIELVSSEHKGNTEPIPDMERLTDCLNFVSEIANIHYWFPLQ